MMRASSWSGLRLRPFLPLVYGLIFVLTACSGDDDDSSGTPPPGESPTPSDGTPTPPGYTPTPPGYTPTPTEPPTPVTDADDDGVPAASDCDDADPDIRPGVPEVCDERDNDCDGAIDEGVASSWYRDRDGDGFGGLEVRACTQPAGYVTRPDDCDDRNDVVHPDATPVCNGQDNDCDGRLDEESSWYTDLDGDGFGDPASGVTACTAPEGRTAVTGDCNDGDLATHPGAADPDGGADQDCGGTPGVDPCVGLDIHCQDSIQAALDASIDGQTLWVGPGLWLEHSVRYSGRAVTLAATHGAELTVIDAQGLGPVVLFDDGEGPDSVLRGFTLTGGITGVRIEAGDPTLEDLVIRDNTAESGGGLYLSHANPTLTRCRIRDNQATSLYEGGGGAHLEFSDPVFTDCTLSGNRAAASNGGAAYLQRSSPSFIRCTLTGNVAREGGGLYLLGSDPVLENTLLARNTASLGGGLYLHESSPTLTQCVLAGNSATQYGGGIYLYLETTRPTIRNSIFARNAGYNLYNGSTSSVAAPAITYSTIYSPYGPSHNLSGLHVSNKTVDPQFMAYVPDRVAANEDYHLRPGSPSLDAGDPATFDGDGSRADMGLYGGPEADRRYQEDQDRDGLPDGWERLHGLDPGLDDAAADPDGDGLTQAEELDAHTDPRRRDSDSDGASDGDELTASRDPLDWYSQPGKGTMTAKIPDHFDRVQEAIDAIWDEGRIELTPGRYRENLWIELRSVNLRGRDGAASTVLEGAGSRVVTALFSSIEMRGLTLTGGTEEQGGGLLLHYVDGSIQEMRVTGNEASGDAAQGGGAWILASSVALEDSLFEGNRAAGVSAVGGGLYLARSSSLTMTGCTLRDNSALAEDDQAGAGGGLYLENAGPTLESCILTGNLASGQGGGVSMNGSSPTLSHVLIEDNGVEGFEVAGGGAYLLASSPVLTNVVLSGNRAEGSYSGAGGGLYGRSSSPRFTHGVVVGNEATWGGGVALFGAGSTPGTLSHLILAYNTTQNLWVSGGSPEKVVVFTVSSLYNPAGEESTNLSSLDPSIRIDEPGFLRYAAGLPADLHLGLDSPLIDAGDAAVKDPDGSRADPGAYGGPGGGGWDLDQDGFPAWYWPGEHADAPAGVSAGNYDCDDGDPSVRNCAM